MRYVELAGILGAVIRDGEKITILYRETGIWVADSVHIGRVGGCDVAESNSGSANK